MDFSRILEFLHKEHLSFTKQKANPRAELPYKYKKPQTGFRTLIQESPAYKGTPVEQAAIIDYAIDLSNSSQEELIYWDLFAVLLDHDASPWHKYARNQGINNIMEAYLDLALPLPALKFRLRNGEASQWRSLRLPSAKDSRK